jgi:hypothetical protein
MVEESTVTEAARRTLVPLFKTGLYDPLDDVAWTTIGADVVASAQHLAIRDEAAVQVRLCPILTHPPRVFLCAF